MKVLNLPIEPLEERYSTQWDKWFQDGFKKEEVEYLTIHGDVTKGKIEFGSFLDVMETNRYKTWQTTAIITTLQRYKDDYTLILFFHDLWHPGLTQIAYIRDGMGWKNLKICGCLHAGSYDKHDFLNKTGMTTWARGLENAWFGSIVDEIYVATNFHKSLLCARRTVDSYKVKVTGFPLVPDFLPNKVELEDIIVFPHRLNEEKQPEQFDNLQDAMNEEAAIYGWKWYKTKEAVQTKMEYYKLLGKAKVAVSFALQETWGIAMQEAVLCGCIPICPNRLSYTECCVLFRVARLRTVINGYTIDSILFNKETGLELMEVNCVGEKTNITDIILSLMNLTIIEHKDLSHD